MHNQPPPPDPSKRSRLKPVSLFASKAVSEQRLARCKACDQLDKTLWQCRECKCLVFFKARLPNSSCPLGYW